jgi:predicted PhzF superfamily epimerase YddE/YHI9
MAIPIFHVDAFTDHPFAGNPAAVCLLPRPAPERWMQQVAAEMNLSETAFLLAEGDGYRLRWFTPAVEVDLCGHATLASAHVLWEAGYLEPDEEVQFLTRSGLLTAEQRAAGIELDFPARPASPCPPPPGLLDALGTAAAWVGHNGMDYLVVVEDEQTVRGLRPDFARLAALPVRGVIVSSQADSRDCDFVSRFFAPAAGIAEDPVTGSAHCCLGPFWGERLGKQDLVGYQASARGGVVRVRVQGDRVRLGGRAVTVLRGELCCPVEG